MDALLIFAAPILGAVLIVAGLMFYGQQRRRPTHGGTTTLKFKGFEVSTDYPSVVAILLGAFLVVFPSTPLCRSANPANGPAAVQKVPELTVTGTVALKGRTAADAARVFIVTEANVPPLIGTHGTFNLTIPATYKSYMGVAYATDGTHKDVYLGDISWSADHKTGTFNAELDLSGGTATTARVADAAVLKMARR